jgi:hypothetical protein
MEKIRILLSQSIKNNEYTKPLKNNFEAECEPKKDCL